MSLRLVLAALAGVLGWAVLAAPLPGVALAPEVTAAASRTGATHGVTAVLLGFRAYDTLLEVAVLLLAVLGAAAAAPEPGAPRRPPPPDPVLHALANAIAPLMLLVAGYLLWAGSTQPGGAFQAGAVLAAAGVLLHLAGLLPPPDPERAWWRLGLAGGPAAFLAALLLGVLPALLLPLETLLTAAIGLALYTLFASARR